MIIEGFIWLAEITEIDALRAKAKAEGVSTETLVNLLLQKQIV